MKTKVFAMGIALMLLSVVGFAQWKLGVGISGSMPGSYFSDKAIDLGYGFYIQPKCEVVKNFELGFDAGVTFLNTDKNSDADENDTQYRVISGVIRGIYTMNDLFEGEITPYAGVGIGSYYFHRKTDGGNEFNYLDGGVSPQIGAKYKMFDVSATYTFLSPKENPKDKITPDYASTLFTVNLGVNLNLSK